MLSKRQILVASLAALILAPLAEADMVMKRSHAKMDMPANDQVHPLEGLVFGSPEVESVAEITSIRLKSLPDESAERVKVVWVVTMSNTRATTQVVIFAITLRDEQGKRLATGRGRLSIATDTFDKEYQVKMKVKAAAWQASSKVELEASWIG